MIEQYFVRARDLRPGDVIVPDMCVRAVRLLGAERMEVVVAQRGEGPEMTGYCGPETWIQLSKEGP